MKFKQTLALCLLLSCSLVSMAAEESIAKENFTPPAAEGALKPERIPPITSIAQAKPRVSEERAPVVGYEMPKETVPSAPVMKQEEAPVTQTSETPRVNQNTEKTGGQ